MSQCPQCYTGTCARHKRQDHGKSAVAMPANSQQTLQKMYDLLVGTKLQKLQAESDKDPSTQSTERFRQQLDASRDKSIKKSSSRNSSSRRKTPSGVVTGSGLNPQALAALYNDSEEDADRSGSDRKAKKSKKSSSKKSSKKHKKDKKSSSSRKSRDKKRKHKRSRSASESDSSSEESDDDDYSSSGSGYSSDGSDAEREQDRKSSRKRSRHSSKKSSKKRSSKRRRTDNE